MATVKNLRNFTGTISGLVYYTVNGKQFVRAETKKRTQTKPKASSKKILPGLEAVSITHALASMNHLMNALEHEFRTLKIPVKRQHSGSAAATITDPERKSTGTDFHQVNVKRPGLANAVSDHAVIKFTVRGTEPELYVIILQINFETGDFRRKKIPLNEAHCVRKNTYTVETEFQARKGYTDLLLLYGEYFLRAVAIEMRNFH